MNFSQNENKNMQLQRVYFKTNRKDIQIKLAMNLTVCHEKIN